MLFNSLDFIIFFPVVTALYFILPQKYRWILLLTASCYFYMAFIPVYILILLFTILIDYVAGIKIENAQGKRRKLFLLLSLVANIGVLAVFKYFNFFNTNLSDLANFLHWNYSIQNLSIILPIGLSFHTFQAMSYTIEVYRGKQKAEKHLGIYSVYVMFYPQLVAGPIERPQNLIHQFYENHKFEYDRVVEGLRLMLWGFFKKLVVADRLAFIVDKIYNNPDNYSGFPLLLATFLFAIQIYCDFSGYSDIAIGSAKVMGYKLMNNFDRPYFSKSISEFWKRWHISLSSWFRDYLYISLGGNRVGKSRWYFNLFMVFFVSGIWHGANWTFIVWGSLHGFYLIFAIVSENIREKISKFIGIDKFPTIHKLWKMSVTFVLVTFAWVFFRANNLSDAFYIIINSFDLSNIDILTNPLMILSKDELVALGIPFESGITRILLLESIISIMVLFLLDFLQRHKRFDLLLSNKQLWLRWAFYSTLFFGIVIFGFESEYQFIYFQF